MYCTQSKVEHNWTKKNDVFQDWLGNACTKVCTKSKVEQMHVLRYVLSPDVRPDFRPDVRPDFRPDVRPDSRPDVRPDFRLFHVLRYVRTAKSKDMYEKQSRTELDKETIVVCSGLAWECMY
jgi:hypothetical protein